MIHSFGFLLLLLLTVTSCQTSETRKRLEQADTLLVIKDKADSALNLLETINENSLESAEDKAYYYLLKTQAQYRLYAKIESDSMIDRSIEFYKKANNKEKLARAYYYKGELCFRRDEKRQSVIYIKIAETNAKGNDYVLNHHISESLAYTNQISGEPKLSQEYARKALSYAEKVGNKDWQLYAMALMIENFKDLHMRDSIRGYIMRMLPLLDYAMPETKTHYLNTIGAYFLESDTAKAKAFLEEALKRGYNGNTYMLMGQLYMEKGWTKEAERMLRRAAEDNFAYTKKNALKALTDLKRKEGRHAEANVLYAELLELKDNMDEKEDGEAIKDLQEEYKKQLYKKEVEHRQKVAAFAVALLAAAVVILVLYLKYRAARTAKQLESSRMMIGDYERRLKAITAEGKEKDKEAKSLRKKIDRLYDETYGILAAGRERFREIQQGQTTVNWGKQDFRNFLEFYKLIDNSFVVSLETDYKGLTDKQKFFMVMQNRGLDGNEIGRMMGIGDTSIRSMKSRIKSKERA